MADRTKIEWSDATWNPVTGCTVGDVLAAMEAAEKGATA